MKTLLLLSFLLLGLAACQPVESATAEPTEPPAEESEVTLVAPSGSVNLQQLTPAPSVVSPPVTQPAPGIPDPAARLIQLAKADLGAKLGVDIDTIRLVSYEAIDWRDSSLGCPKPGEYYLQVITPGYKVFLESGGVTYEYHTDLKTQVVDCTK